MKKAALLGVLLAATLVAAVVAQMARIELPLPSVGGAPSPGPTAPLESPARTATAGPSASPTAVTSCPPVPSGGAEQTRLHSPQAVRVAHQPGFDRVVFDFGTERAATEGLPAYVIEPATAFTNTAGAAVTVAGNAFWQVRFHGASIAGQDGQLAYSGPTSIPPGDATLVRQVKLVDDFEAVMVWGIGLERLQCPRISELRGPLRLVIDLPSPP